MFEKTRYEMKVWFYRQRGRIPVYEIQEDGRIKMTFENPAKRDSRAFDREGCKQQVFLKGYANPVDLSISGDPAESAHIGDEDTDVVTEPVWTDREETPVRLMPSQRYQEYMSQDIISQAIQGGGMDTQKLMWLSAGTLGTVIVGMIVMVSMLT